MFMCVFFSFFVKQEKDHLPHPRSSQHPPPSREQRQRNAKPTPVLCVTKPSTFGLSSGFINIFTKEGGLTAAPSVARGLLERAVSKYTSALTQERGRTTVLSVARVLLKREDR